MKLGYRVKYIHTCYASTTHYFSFCEISADWCMLLQYSGGNAPGP